MNFLFVLALNLFSAPAAAKDVSSTNALGSYIAEVYGDEAPTFTPLRGLPNVAVAQNDTATLKVMDLSVSHYPLIPGRVTFTLTRLLTQAIPENSEMWIVSHVDDYLLYNGSVPVCTYLSLAKLDCPVEADKALTISKHVLEIPREAGEGRMKFATKVIAPNGDLIVNLAGVIDLVDNGSVASEDDWVPPTHDEL